ncbi:MAG: DNA-binding response regulator [Sulfobacillus acidophilus]|uniref:Stage 0 sporulation protein A homolog n=1 Tax=Sulfobacillus acidophilus TaxID=53633 RepID=A0A2T2WHG9_9FIRM|nr:MAG: DNA-binding response regulator [Sulfobacillus acidophilus]
MGHKILIIDDEESIRTLLRVTLRTQGYETAEADSGNAGIACAAQWVPDLIILDLGLPDADHFNVLDQLRQWSNVPIIVLTVHDREQEKVWALDHGADDYVTKPFGVNELQARVRASLRRAHQDPSTPILQVGALTIDLTRRIVERDSHTLKLTPIEYELLRVLTLNAGRVVTQRQLLQQVWGEHVDEDSSHYLRIYVGRLRKKVEPDPSKPQLILTEPGVGYRLTEP